MEKFNPWEQAKKMERDAAAMSPDARKQYRAELEQQISWMDEREPDNQESEEYEAWADAHELLEDLLDEVLDILEE